ncbi:MAG: hypothetical protein ABL883_15080 [Terricaulis sp.]
MVDVVIPDIEDTLLAAYQKRAAAAGISLEEAVKRTLVAYAERVLAEQVDRPNA